MKIRVASSIFHDILHAILQLKNQKDVICHPTLGSAWEGFALEQFILKKGLKDEEVFFWSVHSAAEIDLIYFENGKMNGIEVKYSDSPQITKSMKTAIKDLSLNKLEVLYPGTKSFKLDSKVYAIPIP